MERIIQALAPTRQLDYRVLVTLYNEKNTASKVILNKLKHKYQHRLLDTIISLDYKMQESQIVNQPLLIYDKTAPSAEQYLKLAHYLETI
jgi:cellulose biosynthesis protein BcsQ